MFLYLILMTIPDETMRSFIFRKTFFGIVFVLGIYSIVNMLMMKDIKLYKDRIIQRFRLSKKERVIYLNNAKYNATQTFSYVCMAISPTDRRFNKIVFDPRLIGTNEKKVFYTVLSELTGRSSAELKKTFWNVRLIKEAP